MEDRQIVDLLFSREEQGIYEMDQKYHGYCQSIAWHILGSPEDAEECVNDTWLQTWSCIPPHRPDSLQAFVGKITRRGAIDRYRKRNAARRPDTHLVDVEQETEEVQGAWNAVEQELEQKELADLLNHFLARLPERDRDIFVRRYWYMDSLEEIATRHRRSVGSIRGNLYRNRRKLKEFLEKNEVRVE